MSSRMLRQCPPNRARSRLVPILVACLALVCGTTIFPAGWLEDVTPSLTATAQDALGTAVIPDPGARIEKQTRSQRPSIKGPERGTRVSETTGAPSHRVSKQIRRVFWNLPRRQDHPARTKPISPDAPTDAFPS